MGGVGVWGMARPRRAVGRYGGGLWSGRLCAAPARRGAAWGCAGSVPGRLQCRWWVVACVEPRRAVGRLGLMLIQGRSGHGGGTVWARAWCLGCTTGRRVHSQGRRGAALGVLGSRVRGRCAPWGGMGVPGWSAARHRWSVGRSHVCGPGAPWGGTGMRGVSPGSPPVSRVSGRVRWAAARRGAARGCSGGPGSHVGGASVVAQGGREVHPRRAVGRRGADVSFGSTHGTVRARWVWSRCTPVGRRGAALGCVWVCRSGGGARAFW